MHAPGAFEPPLFLESKRPFGEVNLTFALPVSFAAVRRRILNAVNAGSGEKAWVKTLPLV